MRKQSIKSLHIDYKEVEFNCRTFEIIFRQFTAPGLFWLNIHTPLTKFFDNLLINIQLALLFVFVIVVVFIKFIFFSFLY